MEYFGYGVKDNIFFVFMNGNSLIEKKPGYSTPELFDNSIWIMYPQEKGIKIPLPTYDPDVWSDIYTKGKYHRCTLICYVNFSI